MERTMVILISDARPSYDNMKYYSFNCVMSSCALIGMDKMHSGPRFCLHKKTEAKLLWFLDRKSFWRILPPRSKAMLWLCLAGGNGDKNVKAAVNKNINNKVPHRAWLNWTAKGSFSRRPTEILISPAKSFPPFLPLSYGRSPERQCTPLLCDVTLKGQALPADPQGG